MQMDRLFLIYGMLQMQISLSFIEIITIAYTKRLTYYENKVQSERQIKLNSVGIEFEVILISHQLQNNRLYINDSCIFDNSL